ncbi:MAG: hypothetical protein AAF621_02900 [Pseudomonadota bacterium]
MYLLVTVDTEEEFKWDEGFDRNATSVKNIHDHHNHMYDFYRENEIVPILALSYPVLQDKSASDLIKNYYKAGEAIAAAHLHPWVTPPFKEEVNSFNSYPGNLPYALEYEKLKVLTDYFKDVMDDADVKIYKAGRYGIGPNTTKTLSELGYEYDLSLHPGKNCSYDGGPDQRYVKYHLFKDKQGITHIPVTGLFTGPLSGKKLVQDMVFSEKLSCFRVRGIFSRLGLCEFTTLTPENTPLEDLKKMTLHGKEQGITLFQMTYHSSVFRPGYIPDIKTDEDVLFYRKRIQDYIAFFKSIGGRSVQSFTEIDSIIGSSSIKKTSKAA